MIEVTLNNRMSYKQWRETLDASQSQINVLENKLQLSQHDFAALTARLTTLKTDIANRQIFRKPNLEFLMLQKKILTQQLALLDLQARRALRKDKLQRLKNNHC